MIISASIPPPYSATHRGRDRAAIGAFDYPGRCSRLVLACTYAFNQLTFREKLEGRLVPLLVRVLGMRRFARFVISQGLKQLDKKIADWVVGIIGGQDDRLMVWAWREAMAFDSRPRLSGIRCPTLVVAASNDEAVPMHHSKMLHDGIPGSRLVVVDGADHALIWERPEELVRIVDGFL